MFCLDLKSTFAELCRICQQKSFVTSYWLLHKTWLTHRLLTIVLSWRRCYCQQAPRAKHNYWCNCQIQQSCQPGYVLGISKHLKDSRCHINLLQLLIYWTNCKTDSITCQAPVSFTLLLIGRWYKRQSLKASTLISTTLFTTAKNDARGYTEEKRNTYPNCTNISKQSSQVPQKYKLYI